ncbi:MAG TPA: Na-translocating system protein MpsC family protein [Baekduia sp.]|nr:Na-translocating system protein MpsC family protein [Baekduia sp.]
MRDPATTDGTSVLSEVSNEMVRLYKEQFGRGPTRARAHWAGRNILIATLEDSLTPAERNLAAMGEHQRLRDARLFFQYASEKAFRETVERIVGRRTVAFVSGTDTVADVSAEVFYFAPGDG